MDWNEVPEGVGGKADIAVWHEVVDERREINSLELPPSILEESLPDIIIISNKSSTEHNIMNFTQKVDTHATNLTEKAILINPRI